LLVGDREVAETDDFTPRARFVARVAIGEDPVMQLTGVIPRSSFSPSGYRWSLKRPCPTWIQCPAPDGSAAEDGRRRGKSRHYWSVL
jgi:hypothetical protein